MIPAAVRSEILARLQRAEREHGIRVLLAVESGSRAWGFESPNSDYDARFIYANQPDWYLSVNLEDERDVIEYPIIDDIDLNGWDVRKALRPLLSVRWLERYGTPAPIEFEKLLHLIDDQRTLLADINSLLERKRAAPEMGREPPVESIHAFIEQELDRIESVQVQTSPTTAMDSLNEVFRAAIRE